jgi:hypothetical protein
MTDHESTTEVEFRINGGLLTFPHDLARNILVASG